MKRGEKVSVAILACGVLAVIGAWLADYPTDAQPSRRIEPEPAEAPAPSSHPPRPYGNPPRAPRVAPRAVAPRLEPAEPSPLEARPNDSECYAQCGSRCLTSSEDTCPASCRDQEDCPAGSACVLAIDARGRAGMRCRESECDLDRHPCPDSRQCVFQPFLDRGVFTCEAPGLRASGDFCGETGGSEAARCADGLQCMQGTCVPTYCTDNRQCPLGYGCRPLAGADLKGCVPHCEGDGDCADGMACYKLPTGLSGCVLREKLARCPAEGCPAGLECHVVRDVPWDTREVCVKRCEPQDAQGCPADQRCIPAELRNFQPVQNRCAPRCDDKTPCAEGYACWRGFCSTWPLGGTQQ